MYLGRKEQEAVDAISSLMTHAHTPPPSERHLSSVSNSEFDAKEEFGESRDASVNGEDFDMKRTNSDVEPDASGN